MDPRPHSQAERPRSSRRSALLAAGVVCVIVLAIAIIAIVRESDGHHARVPAAGTAHRSGIVRLPLASLPEGVSARSIAGTPVFFVRHSDTVTTFLTDAHDPPGFHVLYWCPTEEIFIEPIHAGAFDILGRIVGGPAAARTRSTHDRGQGPFSRRAHQRGPKGRYSSVRSPRPNGRELRVPRNRGDAMELRTTVLL